MRNLYRWLVPILCAFLIATMLLAVLGWLQCAGAQSINAEGLGRVTAWSQSHYCYQHRWDFRGDVTAEAGPAHVRARLRVQRWGACNSKIPSAMFNAESGRTMSIWPSVRLTAQWKWLTVGIQYDRRWVHHIWRSKQRHNHFPGSWQIGRSGFSPSRQDSIRPSLGYWDGLRPVVAIQTENTSLSVLGPLIRWKDLTLPWPLLRARGSIDVSQWTLTGYVQGGGHRAWRYTLRLRRQVVGQLHVAAVWGTAALPEWRDRTARRLGISLSIR